MLCAAILRCTLLLKGEPLMRRNVISLAVSMFVVVSIFGLRAASLAGVTLPDTEQVGDTKLLLNGLGLRTKMMVKVYVAGLYVVQKSSDPGAIIKADAPKRIVMGFVRGVSKSQLADAFTESFNDNSADAVKTLKADIERLLGALEPVKEGDQMVFTYVPGTGTTFAINGHEKLTIAGPAFVRSSSRCGSGRSRPMRI